MTNINRILLWLILPAALSCTKLPEADFYEVEGIVSIDGQSIADGSGWVAQAYQTSKPAVSIINPEDQTEPLTVSFYIQNPGIYSLWTLAAVFRDNPDENFISVRVTNEEGFLLLEDKLELPSSGMLEWVNRSKSSEDELFIEFKNPGMYTLRYLPDGKSGYMIDKIHLSLNNERRPQGRGLPETSSPNTDPVLAKRDQPVVIPPAWSFGTFLGGFDNVEQAETAIQQLKEAGISADAIWLDGEQYTFMEDDADYPDLQKFIRHPLLDNLKKGLAASTDNSQSLDLFILSEANFPVLAGNPEIEQLRSYFEVSQDSGDVENSRGFLLAPPNTVYDPDFKLFPSIRSVTTFINPDEFEDVNRYGMEVVRKNLAMVSNRRLSAYEIPYLVPEIEWGDSFEESEISDELFIRWVQFAAFNSMFNLSGILSKTDIENLSDEKTDMLRELIHLRNRLFPYVYSMAHFIRAGGLKPVRGDGVRTTQFLLGDAFLVAPVYEIGADQRTVYFPEGRWYDYWNGTTYEGGQSWIVEASVDKIPVFVKAGSIIPYREYSGTIQNGTNEQMTIEVYGGGVSSFRLYEDDGISTNYQRGEFSTTAFRYFEHDNYSTFTIGRMVRRYQGQAGSKNLKLQFRYMEEPERITVNDIPLQKGEGMEEWTYSVEEKTLFINWDQSNDRKSDFVIYFAE